MEMHPQVSDKKVLACKDFLEALEQCHSNNWARLFGRCNGQKNELNACLRKENVRQRIERRPRQGKLKADEGREKVLQ
ncbi:COX assembly mitochondrial protein [Favolaschia claudopus]|uniref:COX assembly mitochondrial protein n=1 Tax=Favolaschia claudopus TaxID=2862362 RepID=A0AAW0BC29_9AGAR